MTGFEPATSASRMRPARVLSGKQPEVTSTAKAVGPSVGPRTRKEGGTEADSSSDNGLTKGDGEERGKADFTAAVLAIMALPLTDAEKSEAVRRLLSQP